MATNKVFDVYKEAALKGDIDLENDDIRIALIKASVDLGLQDEVTLSAFNSGSGITGDEFDGAGYARQALANQSVVKDDANDRAYFTADDVTLTTLGAGSEGLSSVLVFKFVTDDTDSIPICLNAYQADQIPNGNDFDVVWNPTTGILRVV